MVVERHMNQIVFCSGARGLGGGGTSSALGECEKIASALPKIAYAACAAAGVPAEVNSYAACD